jgi:hypothetical protein
MGGIGVGGKKVWKQILWKYVCEDVDWIQVTQNNVH